MNDDHPSQYTDDELALAFARSAHLVAERMLARLAVENAELYAQAAALIETGHRLAVRCLINHDAGEHRGFEIELSAVNDVGDRTMIRTALYGR